MNDYQLKTISDKQTWEQFVLSRPEANFLQSWNWGVFQQKLDKPIFPLALISNSQQIGAALVVKEEAKRGNYLTIAAGPLLDWRAKDIDQQLGFLFTQLNQLARKHNCSFVRFRPQVKASPKISDLVKKHQCQPAPMHLTADLTLELDLNQSEDQLLAQMRKNTRYEIRKATRLGIEVIESQDPADIKEFHHFQLYLAKKHGFVPFSYEFLFNQFQVFAADNQAALFHAYQSTQSGEKPTTKQLLASAFIIFYHQEAVYHYGISTPTNQKLPGSYACQWAAIKAAKQRGCQKYNFWGVAPQDQPEHRFAGVSLFKRGFGGEAVQYLPAHDLPISWTYQITKTFELARRKSRQLD